MLVIPSPIMAVFKPVKPSHRYANFLHGCFHFRILFSRAAFQNSCLLFIIAEVHGKFT